MSTPQTPIGSGFSATSTAEQVIEGHDLTGRVVIVTGGYAGLGLETVRVLSKAGATIIAPARDIPKAEKALAGIDGVEIEAMDLIDPASIDAFAERFLASGRPLHLLVNSAGIMAPPLTRDARGFESQFATNHLGHFQLTARLWPALVAANGARVVALTSLGHRYSPVVFEDWNYEHREYQKWAGYSQSKTANSLFAVGLDKRGKSHGVRAFAVHPGGILTDLTRYLTREELLAGGAIDEEGHPTARMKTLEQGAATTVWCAVSSSLDGMGGVYCENCDVAPIFPEDPSLPADTTMSANSAQSFGVRNWAVNPEFAERLWTLSEELTGVSFDLTAPAV